jgi:hypothetical protein
MLATRSTFSSNHFCHGWNRLNNFGSVGTSLFRAYTSQALWIADPRSAAFSTCSPMSSTTRWANVSRDSSGRRGSVSAAMMPCSIFQASSPGLASTPRTFVTLGSASTFRASASVAGRLPVPSFFGTS